MELKYTRKKPSTHVYIITTPTLCTDASPISQQAPQQGLHTEFLTFTNKQVKKLGLRRLNNSPKTTQAANGRSQI